MTEEELRREEVREAHCRQLLVVLEDEVVLELGRVAFHMFF